MISDKDLGIVEIHPEIEIGHGQGEEINIEVILDKGTETGVTQEISHGPEEETEGIEVMIDNTEIETGVEIITEILETIGTLDQTEVIDQEAIIEKDIMVTIIEGLTIVLDVTAIKVAIIIRDLRIEVTLMAEGTLEEILHVLMRVYSPCRTLTGHLQRFPKLLRLTLDVEGKPEEKYPNHILENYDFGSMPDEKFHRLMNMNDLSYSALFADKVFENTVWNEYEDKEILNVRSISSSEGNYSMVPEIFIQSKDELLNGVSPKPVIDDESEQEMNSMPCTMVNETDHLTCVNNGNCISLNSVTDNIKSTDSQL